MLTGEETMASKGSLLAIIELGGYPNFTELYKSAGFEVMMTHSVRKALSIMKKTTPDVIVAEFNFQSDFRDRSSSLETLMAPVQRLPETKVIVFYEKDYQPQFEKFRAQYDIHAALSYPINEDQLSEALQMAGQGH